MLTFVLWLVAFSSNEVIQVGNILGSWSKMKQSTQVFQSRVVIG